MANTRKSTVRDKEQSALPAPLRPGEKVNDFAIIRELGSGGSGAVYLATQLSLGREVALKVSENAGQEARMLAQLEHEHIVQVFSETMDLDRNARLICMQYVPGVTLEAVLDTLRPRGETRVTGTDVLSLVESRALTEILLSPQSLKAREFVAGLDEVELAAWFGWRLAEALAYAHERGVLHLDVKPANVLINPYGRPLLTDFSVSLTQSTRFRGTIDYKAVIDSFGGTYEYMPPEQLSVFQSDDPAAAIARIDGRADVFALGKVIQFLLNRLTGRAMGAERRFGAQALEAVLERAVKENPAERYQTAAELAQGFESALELYHMQRQLPANSGILGYASRHPTAALMLFALVPQVLGSVVHNSYNYLQIVGQLTPEQSAAYQQIILIYNCAAYVICAGLIWFPRIISQHRRLAALRSYTGAVGMARLRRQILALPRWVVVITSLGWLPNALLYPGYLHFFISPLPPMLFAHFVLSCVFSWLVALAYSFLYVQYVCLRVLYPRLWLGCTHIAPTARTELAGYAKRLRIFSLLTSLIPLVGASLIVFAGPEQFQSTQYLIFRILVVFLITVGMAGVVFGANAIRQMSKTLRTLFDSEDEHHH